MLSPQHALAELGFYIFPCLANGKRPLTQHGLLDASSDAEQIEQWSSRWPGCNWAVRTDGLLVVDVDGGENQWFNELGERAQELAAAYVSLTPRGGRHFIFRAPDGSNYGNSQSVLGHKVDTRANGGYIVVPPSVVDGKAYRWAGDALDVGPWGLPLPPQWILDALTPRSQAGSTPRAATAHAANRIPDGVRNKTLFSLGCGMRRAGMSQDAIYAALCAENATRCSSPLDDSEIQTIANSASKYESDQGTVFAREHVAEQIAGAEEDESQYFVNEPDQLPPEMLRVPGFISEVMDHCLETAPYPNVALAFCGALCLQAFLAARKVRDSADIRTNVYCLGLAHSASGKDWPRKINSAILSAVEQDAKIGERFSSGEGIEDALQQHLAMLFQTDEIDGLLQAINKGNDARYEGIFNALLTAYSSAASKMPMRKKAGKVKDAPINQPALILFGTAIPSHYYSALSEKMITKGLIGRMVIIEAGKRSSGQEPRILALPARVVDTARWWADRHKTDGNLSELNPSPVIVGYSDGGAKLITASREQADANWATAERAGDEAAMTVWGRVNEHVRKLSLLYAISEQPKSPIITDAAVTWADEFVNYQAKRMLYMVQTHVADSPFHSLCNRIKRLLAKAAGNELSHSKLLKRLHIDAQTLQRAIGTLGQQGDVATEEKQTGGRPATCYRLLRI